MRFSLNDIEIWGQTKAKLFEEIQSLLENKFPSLVITFNLDFLRISYENRKFKDICHSTKLVVPDGVGITKLIKYNYGVKLERITGNDIFRYLLELSGTKEIRYAFVGSTEEVLFKLRAKITTEFPKINNALFYHPPLLFENIGLENKKLIDQLKQFKPEVLFLALGCPRQEIWLYENMNSIGAKINIGVGAVFDFYSGFKKRAPFFVQRIGLEWFWRLITEPRRLFGRYVLKDVPCFFQEVLKVQFKKKS